jgi:hypothetical protein
VSNALAIATVTATLRAVLKRSLTGIHVVGADVLSLRPDAPNLPNPGVNLFLYRVAPNLAFRHSDLPTRRADGTLVKRPLAALDLHYLLTFHGDDNLEEPQRLLGAVVRQLHTQPTLTHDDIRTLAAGQVQLAGTDLADQPELVRVVPDAASLDDLSRVWAMFPETSYMLSALYMASVVLIEAEVETPAPGIPVQSFTLAVVPLALPVIEDVEPQAVDGGTPAAAVTLLGRNLLGGSAAQTSVLIDGAVSVGVDPASTPAAVAFTVPASVAAGVHSVQVVRADPLAPPHIGSASNPAFFALRPRLVSTSLAAGTVTAVLTPVPGARQRVALLLNELTVNPVSRSFTLPAGPRAADTDPVTFDATPVATGATYLTRVQVDGVESALRVDSAGHVTGPNLLVP